MKTVRPKPVPLPSDLRLTPEEGFVLSRIDGSLSVPELVALTGLDAPRLEAIVTKLASSGAIELSAPDPAPTGPLPDGPYPAVPPPAETELDFDDVPTSPGDVEAFTGSEAEDLDETEERPVVDEELSEPIEAQAPETPSAEEEGVAAASDEKSFRALYASRFQGLDVDLRIALAAKETGDALLAFAFDPDPKVVAALLANAASGMAHARLVAAHHANQAGLEILTRSASVLADPLVERRVLRNPAAGDMVLGRVLAPKRLLPVYKIAVDRDVPELTRVRARAAVRQRWLTSSPEERADLLLRTEARCLTVMTGSTFDAKTTQILCGRTTLTSLFVQNITRFAAAPPALLAHLAKQPYVKRSPALKKLLLQHPNLPGDAKRSLH